MQRRVNTSQRVRIGFVTVLLGVIICTLLIATSLSEATSPDGTDSAEGVLYSDEDELLRRHAQLPSTGSQLLMPVPAQATTEATSVPVRSSDADDLAGLVVDETGAPVDGAEVRVYGAESTAAEPILATLAEDGAFLFIGLPRGAWYVSAESETYHASTPVFIKCRGAGERIEITLFVRRCSSIRGTVFQPNGVVAENVSLALTPVASETEYAVDRWRAIKAERGERSRWLLHAETTEGGHYSFTCLEPGEYLIWESRGRHDPVLASVWCRSRAFARIPEPVQQVRALPGIDGKHDIQLLDWGRVEGVVRDADGLPVSATVSLAFRDSRYHEFESAVVASTTTDEGGAWALGELMPGEYVVIASASVFTIPEVAVIDVMPSSSEYIQLTFSGISVSGVVIDSETEEPLRGMRIRLESQMWFAGNDPKANIWGRKFTHSALALGEVGAPVLHSNEAGEFVISNISRDRVAALDRWPTAASMEVHVAGAGYEPAYRILGKWTEWSNANVVVALRKQPDIPTDDESGMR